MLVTLIAGIITGYIVSIPPLGPIAFALISKGFKHEIKEGMSIAFGAAFMDFVYALVAFGGISLLISFLPDSMGRFYSVNMSTIQIVLTYAGCIIVIIYGIRIMKTKTSFEKMEESQSVRITSAKQRSKTLENRAGDFAKHHHVPVVPRVSQSNYFGLLTMGMLLCLSSITLPASWIAIVGYIKGFGIINGSLWGGLLFSAGAFSGTALWFYTLLKVITGNKHRINPSTVSKLNISAGYILIALGVFLFFKASVSIWY
jgi:arginine exporter protein ArgO